LVKNRIQKINGLTALAETVNGVSESLCSLSESLVSAKLPRPILDGLFAFSPNRLTLGGTAYLILAADETGQPANVLIDAPAHEPALLQFITDHGGVQTWVITHRGASGATKALQAALGCPVLVQEQEAYLLPDVPNIVTYGAHHTISPNCDVLWTPGHSPGSACVYLNRSGGVLFTGRHLLPNRHGQLQPLRFSKTFHWPRQLRSVQALQARFSDQPLQYVCPGANTGFLRGQYIVSDAHQQLQSIDLDSLRHLPALL
jgi:glyoxylase-like metal-dependent hydrolase (beta-lactamase superfamily II)